MGADPRVIGLILLHHYLTLASHWVCMAVAGASIGYIFVRYAEYKSERIKNYFGPEVILTISLATIAAWYFTITKGFAYEQVNWMYGLTNIFFLSMGIYLTVRILIKKKKLHLYEVWRSPQKYLFYTLTISITLYGLNSYYCWGCMTFEEAKQQKYYVQVNNIKYDIPWLYTNLNYKWRQTFTPSGKRSSPDSRQKVDSIVIVGLLPNLEIFNETNATEFHHAKGFGKRVRITMRGERRVNWPYYFNNAFKRLIPLPESPVVPGMLRYKDPMSLHSDVYFSDNEPKDKLIRILCHDPMNPKSPPYLACEVQTVYRDKFGLRVKFAQQYLPQWREIDRKTKALLDSFISSANITTKEI